MLPAWRTQGRNGTHRILLGLVDILQVQGRQGWELPNMLHVRRLWRGAEGEKPEVLRTESGGRGWWGQGKK